MIEQGAAAVVAAIPKLEASHLTTEGVTMEASCTVLVLERTTENRIYYITLRACNGQVGNLHILTTDQNIALLALALAV